MKRRKWTRPAPGTLPRGMRPAPEPRNPPVAIDRRHVILLARIGAAGPRGVDVRTLFRALDWTGNLEQAIGNGMLRTLEEAGAIRRLSEPEKWIVWGLA